MLVEATGEYLTSLTKIIFPKKKLNINFIFFHVKCRNVRIHSSKVFNSERIKFVQLNFDSLIRVAQAFSITVSFSFRHYVLKCSESHSSWECHIKKRYQHSETDISTYTNMVLQRGHSWFHHMLPDEPAMTSAIPICSSHILLPDTGCW